MCSSCCRCVLLCYERDLVLSLSDNNKADIIEAFNYTSRYLDDLLNIDNPYSEQMIDISFLTSVKMVNSSDTEVPYLVLNLSITNDMVSSQSYDKQGDFKFEIVNLPIY